MRRKKKVEIQKEHSTKRKNEKNKGAVVIKILFPTQKENTVVKWPSLRTRLAKRKKTEKPTKGLGQNKMAGTEWEEDGICFV